MKPADPISLTIARHYCITALEAVLILTNKPSQVVLDSIKNMLIEAGIENGFELG